MLYNRVYTSTATTGTGSVTPGAAVSAAFLSFAEANGGAAIPNGTSVRYLLQEGQNFEIGIGTFTSGVLTRATVLISKIGGTVGTTKMNLGSYGGGQTVQITAEASDIITASGTGSQGVVSTFAVNNTTSASAVGTGAFTVSGGASIGENLYVGGGLFLTGAISAVAKGQLIGTAGGTLATGALAVGDSNVILYNGGSGNWAGYGADNAGNFWFRVGYSGSAMAPFYLDAASGGDAYFTKAVRSSGPTSGIGYSAGAGGTVTQLTSKATGVTLNKVSGQVTLHAASLAANATVVFTMTNSAIAATDTVAVQIVSGETTDGSYQVWSEKAAAGSVKVCVRNITAGALGEALVLQFNVIKGVNA